MKPTNTYNHRYTGEIYPSLQDFTAQFQAGKTQLAYTWIPGDLETPVAAYMKLCGDEPYSFLLESVEGGAVLGRYSAIGFAPDMLWSYKNDSAQLKAPITGDWQDDNAQNPLDTLKAHIKDARIDAVPESMPPMATSGLFGHLGYDMIRLVEDIPNKNPDTLGIPDALLMRPTMMVLFDNVRQMICISTPVREHAGNCSDSAADIYEQAIARLESTAQKLTAPLNESAYLQETQLTAPLSPQSNVTKEEYAAMVDKTIAHIYAGDIFQAVPSQRFSVPFDLPSITLYRSLRRLNPSPFLFHVKCDDFTLIGSSPEIMVRVRDNTVTIRPIAGTRPRGKTAEEDKANADDLMQDTKELAEHLMLLDLGRNDVGRVAEIGSVKVTEKFCIEYYSHVMHIVSNVEGQLKKDMDSLDALFSGFPAGTVSGAPKIRAMEILDDVEPVRRSFYGGCIGYLDGGGDVDTCIALRTGVLKDGKLYVQAGGGVVADSVAESEYQESCNKAKALIVAAEDAIVHASKHRRKAS